MIEHKQTVTQPKQHIDSQLESSFFASVCSARAQVHDISILLCGLIVTGKTPYPNSYSAVVASITHSRHDMPFELATNEMLQNVNVDMRQTLLDVLESMPNKQVCVPLKYTLLKKLPHQYVNNESASIVWLSLTVPYPSSRRTGFCLCLKWGRNLRLVAQKIKTNMSHHSSHPQNLSP